MSKYDKLLAEVVNTAVRNIGFGEEGSNNSGPFIDALGGVPYGQPSWCALFVGYCYRRAAELTGIELPFSPYRRLDIPEAGALRLVNRIGDAGRMWRDPKYVGPGDVVLWKRIGGHHIGIIERVDDDGEVHTIEGNVGRFPAKVKRLVHDTFQEPHFVTFASIVKVAP